jgi:predicted SAM-dependent methyltransferase
VAQTAETRFFDTSAIPRTAKVLDIGCGDRKKVSWAVGLDRVRTAAADVVHDLDSLPWPFADDSFDVVIASHVVEHLADVLKLSEELYRICRDGAEIRIATPHFSSPDAFVDPTHRHQFGFRSFEFVAAPDQTHQPRLQQVLSPLLGMEATVAGWYTDPKFEIVAREITFRKPHRVLGLDRLARNLPLLYEYFLSGLAPARDMLVTLRVKKHR